MRTVGVLVLLCAPLLLTGCGKKSNADLIVGTWEPVKGDMPPGTTVEFTKDGKMKANMKIGDKTLTMEGTYKVEGDKIKTSMKMGDKEMSDTDTIKTLNDTTLIMEDSKGKTTEMKRK
jgi:uncharacterized protein (TIGR03066 family)